MRTTMRVNVEPIQNLLRKAAPKKSRDLDELFRRLDPSFEFDYTEGRILFHADPTDNRIRIGVNCTIRLQAHAFAAAVIISGLEDPSRKQMTPAERELLFRPADQMLNWCVSHDLQHWLEQREGFRRDIDSIFNGAEPELPDSLMQSLSKTQQAKGAGLFVQASAFILLHELGHLHQGHRRCNGFWSIQQENAADRFAAEWLIDSASQEGDSQSERVGALFAITVALLWLTVFNVYLGQNRRDTHPQGYDRLFQVLDHVIDDRNEADVWEVVAIMLFSHMCSAGYTFEPQTLQGKSSREKVNVLIDMISRRRPS